MTMPSLLCIHAQTTILGFSWKMMSYLERVGIEEWFTSEVNTGMVAAEAVGSIRGTRIPYRASGVPYRFTQ